MYKMYNIPVLHLNWQDCNHFKSQCYVLINSTQSTFVCRYQTLAVATDANTKEDIGNKKVSGKKLTVLMHDIYIVKFSFLNP